MSGLWEDLFSINGRLMYICMRGGDSCPGSREHYYLSILC